MELKWIEDFVSVADLRNFSRAAVARHTAQPALSRRIKSLEAWYGVALIDRSTYPVTLTVAGSAFLPLAKQMVTDVHRSRRTARTKAGISERSVSFAMPHSLAVHFFPAWWRRQDAFAKAKATVVAADLDDCVEMLLNGSCQYLLCYRHDAIGNSLDEHGMERSLVGRDRLVPVSCTTEAGATLHDPDASAAETIPVLAYTKNSFLGRATSGPQGVLGTRCELTCRYESALVEALKAEVLVGEGIAWLPEHMIAAELRAGTLRIVGDEDLVVPVEIWLFHPSSSAPLPGTEPLPTKD